MKNNGNRKWNNKLYVNKDESKGWSYEEALQEAQKLGFAESDPTADVDGLDAARKVAILANLGFR